MGVIISNTDANGNSISHNVITNGQLVISHSLGYDRFLIISTGNAFNGIRYNCRYYAGYHLDNNYTNSQSLGMAKWRRSWNHTYGWCSRSSRFNWTNWCSR